MATDASWAKATSKCLPGKYSSVSTRVDEYSQCMMGVRTHGVSLKLRLHHKKTDDGLSHLVYSAI